MAALTALAIGGLVLQGVGMVRGARAQKKAGEQQQESSESQAELADYNAAVATLQAKDAIARAAQDESDFRTQVRGIIGAQRTALAANNVEVGFGSAVEVQADAAELGERDALRIKTNGAREAWGYSVQAEDFTKRGEITRKEGSNLAAAGKAAATATYIQGGANLLTGSYSLLQQRYGMTRKG